MSIDQVETFGKSVVQHGPANDRVYLMKLNTDDLPPIINRIDSLASLHRYSKVFAKVPASAKTSFAEAGYRVEAKVPRLFKGEEEGLFMARYYNADRHSDDAAGQVQKVLDSALGRAQSEHAVVLPAGCVCRLANPEHCREMADLYRKTFASYPFPIDDPEYLATAMAENVLFAGIWQGRVLLALASAEIDHQNGNAELTDFATHPDWRGHGLANHLLQYLEKELRLFTVKTSYTIARAMSHGMNICFARNGYRYSGTLVKNTQISGGLESMNVWHKSLETAENV